MKRNMDLIRDLLLYVEDQPPGEIIQTVTYDDEKYTEAEVFGHLKLLINANFIDGKLQMTHDRGGLFMARDLTMAGHDFIDAIRNDTVWNQTKEKVSAIGGSVAMEIIKDIALYYGRQLFKLD